MAQKGYWAICEDVYGGTLKSKPQMIITDNDPSMCVVRVQHFFYADVIGETRMEAYLRAMRKLKENILFLDLCCNDIPEPSTSDSPPSEYAEKEGVVLMFIPLEDMGISEDFIEQNAAIAA